MPFGVEKTVIESVEFDEDDGGLIASVRPTRRAASRCGRCRRRAPGYDRGEGRRRWRALDLGTVPVWLEADAPRVNCRVHGPTVRAVPWARHAAGHTLAFDAQVAWLATQCSKTAVTELMRIAWRTVGAIITRVWAETDHAQDRLAGLARIGVDEISYKRGHRYLLKEGLRLIFQLPPEEAPEALEAWIGWARRSRIQAFVDLQRRIIKHREAILASIEHGLSNGRIESVNAQIRLITRVAFGFRSADALIALAMLNLGGHQPVLPGRT